MKIGVLTSTRADFGILTPLLKMLNQDSFFQLEIIAFGTHLSNKFGNTINEIIKAGFETKHKLNTIPENDTPKSISKAMGETMKQFSSFWEENKFDLVIVLGDRYEMFAAVAAGSPFSVNFAHIHAGETTLGAFDNAYRHSISLMSEYIFVTTEEYKQRAIEITQIPEKVFNTGALSIDNLMNQDFYSLQEIKGLFNIDLSKPTVLSTFHPETVAFEKNEEYIDQLIMAFKYLLSNYQLLITMPNADTMGLMIREKLELFAKQNKKVFLRESLGMKGYLSCMKHCSFMLGNTSSGFVEAAFFPKWVINVGDRQKGRIRTANIVDSVALKESILTAIKRIENEITPNNCNIYGKGNSAAKIITLLKQIYNV